jgi:hypothetical protein
MSVNRNVKFWILVSLFSLLFFIIRMIPSSVERFYNIVFISWDYYYRIVVGGAMYSLAAVGIAIRLVGVLTGLIVLALVWNNNRSFADFKKWIAFSIFLEGLYYLLLIPSPIWLFALAGTSTVSYTFGVSYLLQIIFTVPFLLVLTIKVLKNNGKQVDFQVLKWGIIAFSGYTASLWANSVFRWFDLIGAEGIGLFFKGTNAVPALNAFFLMSLAVIFAVIATFSITKQKRSAKKWLGLSLVMIGLHYSIYTIFSYLVGSLSSIWLYDIWTIPLLGLGLAILFDKPHQK